MKYVNVFHIALLPLVIYACWTAYTGKPTHGWIYALIVAIAILGLPFHVSRLLS